MTHFISIYGQVHDNDFNSIHNIKVSVFDKNLHYIDHKHTDIDGKYHLSIPSGRPITVYFDTDSSLKNAREWHPSVVANIYTKKDIVLNRFLMQTNDSTGAAADIDALLLTNSL